MGPQCIVRSISFILNIKSAVNEFSDHACMVACFFLSFFFTFANYETCPSSVT